MTQQPESGNPNDTEPDAPARRLISRRRVLWLPVAGGIALAAAAWPLRELLDDDTPEVPAGPTVIENESNVRLENLELTVEEGGPDFALELRNCQDVVVDGFQFRGAGILVRDCDNVSLRNGFVSRDVAGRERWSDAEAGVRFLHSTNVELINSVVAYADSLIRAEACEGVLIDGCFTFNPRGPFPRGQHFQTWEFDEQRSQDITIRNHYSLTDFETPGPFTPMQEDAFNFGMADNVLVENVLNEMRGAEFGSKSGSGLMFEGRSTARVDGFTSIGQANAGFGVSSGSIVTLENVLSIVPQSPLANIAGFAWQNATVTFGDNVRMYGVKPDGAPYGSWWSTEAVINGLEGTIRGNSNSEVSDAALASVVRPPIPDVGFVLPGAEAVQTS